METNPLLTTVFATSLSRTLSGSSVIGTTKMGPEKHRSTFAAAKSSLFNKSFSAFKTKRVWPQKPELKRRNSYDTLNMSDIIKIREVKKKADEELLQFLELTEQKMNGVKPDQSVLDQLRTIAKEFREYGTRHLLEENSCYQMTMDVQRVQKVLVTTTNPEERDLCIKLLFIISTCSRLEVYLLSSAAKLNKPYQSEEIICRICEQPIEVEKFNEHCKLCATASRWDIAVLNCNDSLNKFHRNEIQKRLKSPLPEVSLNSSDELSETTSKIPPPSPGRIGIPLLNLYRSSSIGFLESVSEIVKNVVAITVDSEQDPVSCCDVLLNNLQKQIKSEEEDLEAHKKRRKSKFSSFFSKSKDMYKKRKSKRDSKRDDKSSKDDNEKEEEEEVSSTPNTPRLEDVKNEISASPPLAASPREKAKRFAQVKPENQPSDEDLNIREEYLQIAKNAEKLVAKKCEALRKAHVTACRLSTGKSYFDEMTLSNSPRLTTPRNSPQLDARLQSPKISSPRIHSPLGSPRVGQKPTLADFQVLKPITKGGFGRVYLVQKKRTGDIYAMKVMKKEELVNKNKVEHVVREQQILATAHNPFVVKMYYSFQTRESLYLVMEYCCGGDVYSLLQGLGALDESAAQFYIAELVLALEYLRKHGIVHRDIKPDNLLITKDGHLKLTDFGLSYVGLLGNEKQSLTARTAPLDVLDDKPLIRCRSATMAEICSSPPRPEQKYGKDSTSRHSVIGTPYYLAPEILLGIGHSFPVDIWSMGVVLYEMITGILPFYGSDVETIFEAILKLEINWDKSLSPKAHDFISRILVLNPLARLGTQGMDEVKSHPFFHGIDFNTVTTQTPAFRPILDSETDISYFECRSDQYSVKPEEDKELSKPQGQDNMWQLSSSPPSVDSSDNMFGAFWHINLEDLQKKNRQVFEQHQQQRELQRKPINPSKSFSPEITRHSGEDKKSMSQGIVSSSLVKESTENETPTNIGSTSTSTSTTNLLNTANTANTANITIITTNTANTSTNTSKSNTSNKTPNSLSAANSSENVLLQKTESDLATTDFNTTKENKQSVEKVVEPSHVRGKKSTKKAHTKSRKSKERRKQDKKNKTQEDSALSEDDEEFTTNKDESSGSFLELEISL